MTSARGRPRRPPRGGLCRSWGGAAGLSLRSGRTTRAREGAFVVRGARGQRRPERRPLSAGRRRGSVPSVGMNDALPPAAKGALSARDLCRVFLRLGERRNRGRGPLLRSLGPQLRTRHELAGHDFTSSWGRTNPRPSSPSDPSLPMSRELAAPRALLNARPQRAAKWGRVRAVSCSARGVGGLRPQVFVQARETRNMTVKTSTTMIGLHSL